MIFQPSRRWTQRTLALVALASYAEPPTQQTSTPRTAFYRTEHLKNQRKLVWTETDHLTFDVRDITPLAASVLKTLGPSWRHAQSDHFVIHFEREIFARKVARMGEFFYSYIANEMEGSRQTVAGRSHIFLYRNEEKWDKFVKQMNGTMEWAAAMVEGNTMYLRQLGDRRASADLLAHEMSHLVLNRYFYHRLPIWLNEGLAEWYEEFAYAAFKGVKKSRRSQFKRLKSPLSLRSLIALESYPPTQEERARFYQTSKHLVGFLRLAWPEKRFRTFLGDMIRRPETEALLSKHFQVEGVEELEQAFLKFGR